MTNENSKEVILHNAIVLFSQKGYEGVGVQEICESAGITKPTLYYFFKNKQGLLEAVVSFKGEALLEQLKTAAVYEHDFIKGLTNILRTEIGFACENPSFFNLHCVLLNAPENSEGKSIYTPLIEKLTELFTGFFVQSANEFGNMRGKESLYALLYHRTVTSVAALCANQKLSVSDELVYQIVHSFVYGVAN